jgi:pantoate--beta-alanine ligase
VTALRRCTTIGSLRGAVAQARSEGASIGFLPTMGALHEGHLEGVRLLAARCDVVVVSIFVNPTQFDRADDLAAYPRDLPADEAALAALALDVPLLVFAPEVAELYPTEPRTTVHVSDLTEVLEGAARPGHFDGVATVVTKLVNIVAPDVIAFGRKDHQQLQVVRRMFDDLDVDVEVLEIPTVREADGVALSSRNRRLDDDDRRAARALSRSLLAAVRAARTLRSAGGRHDAAELERAARTVLDATPVEVEYLAVVEPATLRPPDGVTEGPLTVAVAAYVGSVRLIDNVLVGDLDDEGRLLAAADRDDTEV